MALIDLDGTLYRGNEVVPGAPGFVARLRTRNIQPVFFTNNATRTPEETAQKLQGLGIAAQPEEVCTSGQAASSWLRRQHGAGARVAYLGAPGLERALDAEGLEPVAVDVADTGTASTWTSPVVCDAAVIGLDQTVTYGRLARFCSTVSALGRFVLTNADVRLPVARGFLPGCGALGQFVQTATGIEPVITGKPSVWFVAYALERFGAEVQTTLMIGDNLRTDILAGKRAGIYSIQVRTGVQDTSAEDDGGDIWLHADEVVPSVANLFVS